MTEQPNTLGVMDAIFRRHSVRSYLPDPIDRSTIQSLLKAAVQAPTGLDMEPWAFVIVQDPQLLKRLSDLAKSVFLEEAHRAHLDEGLRTFEYLENSEFNLFYNAGSLVLICAESRDIFGMPDSWLAAMNLILAARAHGLGTCVIGSATAGLNTGEAKALLNIPEGFTVVVPIVLGVPAAEGVPAPRRPPRVLNWY